MKALSPINSMWWIMALLLSILTGCGGSQNPQLPQATKLPTGTEIVVGFYNVENLFDTKDNMRTADDDFLPQGRYEWTPEKYQVKLDNLAKAIQSMEGGPEMLGVAEIENRKVLEDLIKCQALQAKGYRIVHDESPDARGIDVGFIYQAQKFQLETYKVYQVDLPGNPDFRTREILMVEGKVNGTPIYVIVNHWPSRREGQAESEPRRVAAAQKVNQIIQEIQKKDPDPCILIMGDFNDDPGDKSIAEVIGAQSKAVSVANNGFFNPMFDLLDRDRRGTLTYRGKWNLFDQVLVSEDLLSGNEGLQYVEGSTKIHSVDLLKVGGDGRSRQMPKRAIYRGEFKENGFSDHFPVYIRLKVTQD
ncbi:MAG: endonuclease/exonuclease/phosphatase family protein [Bacteroidota bacterium]